ncbi:hypothetical protein KAM329D_28920 [Aeromonas caviae]|nr:hypothetical protein KAM341_30790 [Aeromonas caviae]GJA37925.1 hypothetical protein KAM342_31680 [Aeromonas caviae]GJA50898.1 hypothetical protein KAM347_26890 [Aeromonas caviae]GJA59749.1 hypothetical protein KAM350_27420 [Aeromonas caviae]GJA68865.1 hypothetical protein KAM352_28410 [Aeromonas caviae]
MPAQAAPDADRPQLTAASLPDVIVCMAPLPERWLDPASLLVRRLQQQALLLAGSQPDPFALTQPQLGE